VGVTPSSISQIEGGLIYPSLPALFRMADVFAVDMGSLFMDGRTSGAPVVFKPTDLQPAALPDIADTAARCWRLPGIASGDRPAPLLIEIPPGAKLPAHFCRDKGREVGYLLHGTLVMTYREKDHVLEAGDFIHISESWPTAWENPGDAVARLLWLVAGSA
jgi:quercetin dioxygenase-like cupin family protein/DNA-binding XRE family transcriptional regulator